MARNGSKTVNSEVHFLIVIKQRVIKWPSRLNKVKLID